MLRRSFLSMLGSALAVPALPVPAFAGTSGAAAGYSRYVYGYAVFKARTGTAFKAADLVAGLKVTPAQANAMMAEMARDGVIRPALGGAVQAVSPHGGGKTPWLRNFGQKLKDWVEETSSEKLEAMWEADTASEDTSSDQTPSDAEDAPHQET